MVEIGLQRVLSIEELVQEWGKPREHPTFNSQEAASHRTWLAISNYVAYHDARKLNALFQGIDFPHMQLSTQNISFPSTLEEVMTPDTRRKFAYLRENPRLYGSMQTRLQLFQNIVDAMDDETANFRVGRNIRVNKDMGTLKLTLESGVKGLLKVFGANPAKILAKRMTDANRALNTFLDTRVAQYGSNFMDVRVEYFDLKDVSVEGDHYTLGTILGGLETISAYKQVEITALQTPFDAQVEGVKARMYEPGMRYVFENYVHDPTSPVFLYRYTFQEPAQFVKRVLRAVGDLARNNLPSRMTRAEMQEEGQQRQLLNQVRELDERALSEYKAQVEAQSARADAAEARASQAEMLVVAERAKVEATEARRTLEESVSGVNQVFGEMRTLAHDSKNYALALRAQSCDLLKVSMEQLPEDLQVKYNGLFETDETLLQGLEQMKNDLSIPDEVKTVVDHATKTIEFIRYVAEHTQRSLETLDGIISNERLIMAGGIPVDIQRVPYERVIRPVAENVKLIYPNVRIEYNLPEGLLVDADQRLMKVAMVNLLSNAVEASLPDGRVKVDVAQRTRGERTFTIIDLYQSGYIPPEIVEKLNRAEKFTTKEQGNATGAAASYNIITGPHNGKLTYESLGPGEEFGGRIRIVI